MFWLFSLADSIANNLQFKPFFFNISLDVLYFLNIFLMMDEHSEHHSEHHAEHHGIPEIPKVDFKNVNAGSLKGGFGDILEVLKLNKHRIEQLGNRDSEGIGLALVYLGIGAIAAPLGGWILGYNIPYFGTIHNGVGNALISAVVAVVMAFIGLYVTSLVAEKFFQGHGKFPQYFRVMGYAYLLNIIGFLTIVPVLSMLASLWLLVVNFFALTVVHKLNNTNAALTLVVTIVVFVVLGSVVAALGLMSAGGFSGSSFSLSY